MTSEQTKQEQQISQLTDYREDWPEGKKGALFYVHGRNALYLLDCPWRKGANWDDFPKLFPYEEELINDTSNQILYGYGAFLLQSWHRKMPLIKDSEIIDQNEIGEYLNLPDLDTLQEHYYQQDFWQMEATWGKALCSNVLHESNYLKHAT